jgi:hypothetical protein
VSKITIIGGVMKKEDGTNLDKFGGVLWGAFTILIALYFISINFMGIYYTYKDIKTHDSFGRFLFISPLVGFLKATHWPYYEFFKNGENAATVEYGNSIKSFFMSQKLLDAGTEAVKGKTQESAKAAYQLIKASRENALKCNTEELNRIYPEWGTIVRDKFIPALDTLIISMDKKLEADPAELAKGEILLQEYFDWTEENSIGLVKTLEKNTKSGT